MIARIIKLCYLKSLLFFCAISIAQASSFYDLKEGIKRDIGGPELKTISFTKHAHIASENFRFPPQFLDQTRKMMGREAVFRHKCNVADGTNVAQLCVYGTYKGSSDWKFIEIFDPKSCKGHFYLSGNDPVLFTQERKPNNSPSIDVQKVSLEKGYMQIHQRLQPLLETIRYTVQFLENIGEFVENLSPDALDLARQALTKHNDIRELTEKKNQIIRELEQQARQLEQPRDTHDTLVHSTHNFMIGILGELIRCLDGDDFCFYGMKDAVNNANLKGLVSSIQKKLVEISAIQKKSAESSTTSKKTPERELNELLNSKHFNLGCSEPLVLFDLLNDQLDRAELINEMRKALFNDELDGIYVQLHSTKTPCRSCLIGCCGHLLHGVIRSFFDEVRKEIKSSIKREDVNIRFLISYQAPYEDEYPFYVPFTSDLSFSPHAVLLVNMQLYDEQFRKMKERVVKEERLKTETVLMRKLEEKKGPLNQEDFKAAGLIK